MLADRILLRRIIGNGNASAVCTSIIFSHGVSARKVLHARDGAREVAPITIAALARNILAIIHYLLTNMELYEEPGVRKKVNRQKVSGCGEFGIGRSAELSIR